MIALRWKPTAFLPAPFRASAASSMIALASVHGAEPAEMLPNVPELLQDMLRLGGGLLSAAEPVR